jgi:class 3 adenylate cyclase
LVSAPRAGDPNTIANIIYACFALGSALIAFYLFSRTNFYIRFAYAEIPFFLAIFGCQLMMNFALMPLSLKIGSSPANLIASNTAILIFVFSIIAIGAWRAFALLTILMATVSLAILLALGSSLQALTGQSAPIFIALIGGIFANRAINESKLHAHKFSEELKEERTKVETLLFNVLPEQVAKRLQQGETIADAYSEVAIIFVDLVGFTEMSTKYSPTHLLQILNRFFLEADACAEKYKIEKVKTIGDAYLAVVGAQIRHDNPATIAIAFSNRLRERLACVATSKDKPLSVRIGIHTGSVIGGVIGDVRKSYDFWGESMNIASRIQAAAEPNTILVSESAYLRAEEDFRFLKPKVVVLKGLGEAKVYELIGPQSSDSGKVSDPN